MKWRVTPVDEEATEQVAFLLEDENVGEAVKNAIKSLIRQADPRGPSPNARLDVIELDNFPNWFRLKITKPQQVRLIFRVYIVKNEDSVLVPRLQPIPDDAEEGYLEIMMAGFRDDETYGSELRNLYRRHERDEE